MLNMCIENNIYVGLSRVAKRTYWDLAADMAPQVDRKNWQVAKSG